MLMAKICAHIHICPNHPRFLAWTKRLREGSTISANFLRSIVGLPVVQDLLQKIDKFAIAPLRHLLGISDFLPSLNHDIDARAEVKSYVNMPATYSYVEADTQLLAITIISEYNTVFYKCEHCEAFYTCIVYKQYSSVDTITGISVVLRNSHHLFLLCKTLTFNWFALFNHALISGITVSGSEPDNSRWMVCIG